MFNVVVLQNVVSSFEKGSNGQNHSLSDSNHSIKNFPLAEFPIPLPLNAISSMLLGKPLGRSY